MAERKVQSGWARIDQDLIPVAFVQYMDTVNAQEWMKNHKIRALALLSPQRGHQIIDVGCGTGVELRSLGLEVGSAGRIVGLDCSETMIATARKRSERLDLPIEFHLGDVYHIPFASASFDSCYTFGTLEILENPRQALAEMVRVLRSGGRIVTSAPDLETWTVDSDNDAMTRRIMNFWCDSLPNGWMGRRLYGLFRELGLADIEVYADTWVITDFALFKIVWLGPIVEDAQAAGIVSGLEAASWFKDLGQASQSHRFFSTHTRFIAKAIKS